MIGKGGRRLQYHIYLDKLFIWIYIGNTFVLKGLHILLRCTATCRSILLRAFVFSVFEILLFIVPIGTLHGKLWVIGMLGVFPMLWLVYYPVRIKLRGYHIGNAVMCQFVFCSMIHYLFLTGNRAAALCGAGIILLFAQYLEQRKWKRMYASYLYPVTLVYGKYKWNLTGFLDTGNHIYDNIKKKPVAVLLQKESGEALLQAAELKRYPIPFHSAGCSAGYMYGCELDCMLIELDDYRKMIAKPIVAIADAALYENSPYQILLHPLMIEE